MPKRILIIDDDEDILEILNIIFQSSGYEIILSKTSQTSQDILQVIHPDLVLMDVRIAGSDKSGAEICKELKTQTSEKHMPVILLSGEFNLDAIAKDCMADDFINKPFEVDNLLFQIKKHLS